MLVSDVQVFLSVAYHYLVVGGGTAGLTVAARLSEDPSINVGVLEAGLWENDDPRVFTPGLYGIGVGTNLDWNFSSIPQAQLDGGVLGQARGKMLGGSSGLNYMLWNRASVGEYDAWEELGNPGWNWDAILQYSKKVEHANRPFLRSQLQMAPSPPFIDGFHGFDGPVQTSFSRWHAESALAFLPALGQVIDIPTNTEPMSGSNLGGYVSLNSIDGRNATRSYAATDYLEPNLNRSNLVVLTGAMVTKVTLNGDVATGVEFAVDNTSHTVQAAKEIILSAGAVQSPQLLELSGIGGRAVLDAAGVETLIDNPNVGENFQDHILVPVTYEFIPGQETPDFFSNTTFFARAQEEYDNHRTGILAGVNSHFAMLPLDVFMSEQEISDVIALAENSTQFASNPRDQALNQMLVSQMKNESIAQLELLFVPRKVATTFTAEPGKSYLSFDVAIVKPHSRGSIHINSSDPFAHPVLDPNVYASPVDQTVMVAGLRLVDKVANTHPVKNFLAQRIGPAGPGPLESGANLTDEVWWEYAKQNSASVRHPIGTCSMLPKEKGGVVDDQLRVYGVRGLRVVDASIIPIHVAAHIQATVYSIAERAADLIKAESSV